MQKAPPSIDLHGDTHLGRVRAENQDHFLVCSLEPGTSTVQVWRTSIQDPPADWRGRPGESPSPGGALLAAVADGVGGGPGGERASRAALRHLPASVAAALEGEADPSELESRLVGAVLQVHSAVVAEARAELGLGGMASTLTVWLGLPDRAYLLQVGDSRCYRARDGHLEQLSQDQTMAQDMVDRGVLETVEQAPAGWDNILTSAVGGTAAVPAILRTDRRPGDCTLICSDGVMKHVADEELEDVLLSTRTAREKVGHLISEALDRGGSDNITAVVIHEAPGEVPA